jgi:hypothetical protein
MTADASSTTSVTLVLGTAHFEQSLREQLALRDMLTHHALRGPNRCSPTLDHNAVLIKPERQRIAWPEPKPSTKRRRDHHAPILTEPDAYCRHLPRSVSFAIQT